MYQRKIELYWNFGQSNGQFKSYLSNNIQILDEQNVELTELQDFKNEQFHINGLYNSQIQKLIYNCKKVRLVLEN